MITLTTVISIIKESKTAPHLSWKRCPAQGIQKHKQTRQWMKMTGRILIQARWHHTQQRLHLTWRFHHSATISAVGEGVETNQVGQLVSGRQQGPQQVLLVLVWVQEYSVSCLTYLWPRLQRRYMNGWKWWWLDEKLLWVLFLWKHQLNLAFWRPVKTALGHLMMNKHCFKSPIWMYSGVNKHYFKSPILDVHQVNKHYFNHPFWTYIRVNKHYFKSPILDIHWGEQTVLNHPFWTYTVVNKHYFKSCILDLHQDEQRSSNHKQKMSSLF